MDLYEAVYRILDARKISNQKLADMLHYGSATSVSRLLNRKTTIDTFHEFVSRLVTLDGLSLSDEEIMSLGIPGNELANDLLCLKLWNLLTCVQPAACDDIAVSEVSACRYRSLSAFLRGNPGGELESVNISSRNVALLLKELAPETNLTVKSYFIQNGSVSSTIDMLDGIFPLLGLPWFSSFTIDNEENRIKNGMLAGQFALYSAPGKNYLLIPETSRRIRISELQRDAAETLRGAIFQNAFISQMHNKASDEVDYDEYLNYCMNLESGNEIFQLKSDFGIEQVPVDIQTRLAERGPFAGVDGFERIKNSLMDIQTRRYANLRDMKFVQNRVYTKEGFKSFAATGRSSDHFWGFDSMTPAERKVTLASILEQVQHNRFYSLRFLKDGASFCFNEITQYSRHGITLLLPATDYKLGSGIIEFLIKNPEFERFFMRTFNKWMHSEKLEDKACSAAFLERLICEI